MVFSLKGRQTILSSYGTQIDIIASEMKELSKGESHP